MIANVHAGMIVLNIKTIIAKGWPMHTGIHSSGWFSDSKDSGRKENCETLWYPLQGRLMDIGQHIHHPPGMIAFMSTF